MTAGANPLLAHRWEISPGEDRVWAQIAGRAPSTKPWKRLFVVLQAYIDESYRPDGFFVMAGYIATAEAWAKFSSEWEPLLPQATRNKEGKYRFKMREMRQFMERVPAFYRVIEENVLASVSLYYRYGDLRRA